MFGIVLQMLKALDHYGVSKNIDIAKGANKFNTSFRKIYLQEKRRKWRKYE